MKYTIPLHIFFHYTRIWKKISVGGLYTSLFCAIIPALFPYFLPFWYPYILLHFQMFFITCRIVGCGTCGVSHVLNNHCSVFCTCLHSNMHIHAHARTCAQTRTCSHTRTNTHAHTHAQTHTHTHTQEIDPSVLDMDEIPNDDLGKNQSELHSVN